MGKIKEATSVDANDVFTSGGGSKKLIEQYEQQQQDTSNSNHSTGIDKDNDVLCEQQCEQITNYILQTGLRGTINSEYFEFEHVLLSEYRYNLNSLKLEYQFTPEEPYTPIADIVIYTGVVIDYDGLHHHNISIMQNGEFTNCLVPVGIRDDQLLNKLYDKGLSVHYNRKYKAKCKEFILRCANVQTNKLQGKKIFNSGYVDDYTYFYPNDTKEMVFIGKNHAQYYDMQNKKDDSRQIMGKLYDWQNNIAKYCIGNPIYEFCLYVGFAGMLLKDLNISMSTGFHIYSYEGGTGKTLACKVAATVMGNVDYIVHQWNQTTNNLDLICAKSNNGLLVLDEIKQLKKSCALSDIIMKLGNNKGAGRMAQDTQSSREHFSWLMYYLSTGNNLTEQIILEREGNNLLGAEETRLYNMQMIKAQEFHGLNDHREFTKHLYTNIDKHCGIAGYEFLTQYLNSNYDDNKRYLLGIFEDMQNKIQNLINVNKKDLNNCDVHDRIISAFSVVATAGEMAKHLKILPDEFKPLESVCHILFEYLKNRGGNIDQRTYLTKLYKYVVTERNTYFKHDNFEPKYNYGYITKENQKEYAEIVTTNFANIYGFSNYKDTAAIRDFLINCRVMVGNGAYQKNKGKRYVKIDIEVLENLVT